MKVNLINKYKWYIFGAIAVVLIMSIGLSFCAWDSNSIRNLSINGGVSDYKPYSLVVDGNNNLVADVGDTVLFGDYYQQSNETTKSPVEWRVVDIRVENGKDVLYLLSEKVLAYGAMSSYSWYYDNDGNLQTPTAFVYPKYDDSTIRAWLNSDDVARDSTVNFKNPTEKHVVYKGFYNEAFSAIEKDIIITRDIGGMKGLGYNDHHLFDLTIIQYEGVKNQKVWIPSYTEVFGKVPVTGTVDGLNGPKDANDYSGDSQFSYFSDGSVEKRIGKTSLFASSVTANGLAHFNLYGVTTNPKVYGVPQDSESPANWWIRTPNPIQPTRNMSIWSSGTLNIFYMAYDSRSGVRPAICIAR